MISRNHFHFLGAVVLLLIALGCLQGMSRPGEMELVRPLGDIPLSLGGWEGRSITFDQRTLDNSGVDHYIMRVYHACSRPPVSVYVGFYRYQKVGHTIHSPRRCCTGSGWELESVGMSRIPASGSGWGEFPVNRLLVRKGGARQVVYYWFQSRGRIVTNEYREKLYLILDTIFKGRNDGAVVRISTDLDSAGDAEENLREFIAAFYPHLLHCLP